MAYAIVSSSAKNGGGGYVQQWDHAHSFTAGNAAVVALAAGEGDAPTLTDLTHSQLWVELNETVNIGDRRAELWLILNVSTTGSKTTRFYSGGNWADSAAYFFEISGLSATTPLDQIAEAVADAVTTHASGATAALAQSNEMVVGVMAATNQVPGVTGDASYGTLYSATGFDSWTSVHVQFKSAGSTAGQSYTVTTSSGTHSSTMVVTLKESGGAPPPADTSKFFF